MKPLEVATVALEPGVTLIEASAGTGKTYSIAALFLRLVIEERLPISRILCVTYTVAATQELRERIRRRLQEARHALRNGGEPPPCADADPVITAFLARGGDLPQAVRDLETAVQSFDEAAIFTIHGFCQRTLQEHAFESGARYGSETLEDPAPLYDEVIGDFWRRTFYRAAPLSGALATAWGLTPQPWGELLRRIRNHPAVTVIPAPGPQTPAALETALAQTYETLRADWPRERGAIAEILHHDKALGRSATTFRADRVADLLSRLERLPEAQPDPGALRAIREVSRSALEGAVKSGKSAPRHPFFDHCETFVQTAGEYLARLDHDFLAYAEQELARRKGNRLGFDDLLTHLHRALHGPGAPTLIAALRERYAVTLVDEFQDTDPLQAAIFEKLFASQRLLLIGDPKQAIYGFRGADIFTYLTSARTAARAYNLAINWRSDPALIKAFNALFTRTPHPFLLGGIGYHPVEPAPGRAPGVAAPFTCRYLEEEQTNASVAVTRVARTVADDIARLLAQGRYQPGDLAVLVRKHWQAAEVARWLRKRGIPAVLQTQENVFRSREAEWLAIFLRAVTEPRREPAQRAALATPLFGLDAAAFAALERDDARREQWLATFTGWHEEWTRDGFMALFRRVLVEQGVRERLLAEAEGERAVTNLLHLSELLHAEATARRLAPDALLHWFEEERRCPYPPGEGAQLRLESDEAAVRIVTIHKSKGLEYPVVFCPFLWNGSSRKKGPGGPILYHDAGGAMRLDLRGPEAPSEDQETARNEALAEEMRLLYVAVTRARQRCFLYAGDFPGVAQSALATLFTPEAPDTPPPPVRESLHALAARFPEAIGFEPVLPESAEAAGAAPHPTAEEAPAVPAREFTGTIRRTPLLTSFTALVSRTHGETLEVVDPPATEEPADAPPQPDAPAAPIFRFEKGPRAGDFFHAVLERLDFQAPDELARLIPEQLVLHGLAEAAPSPAPPPGTPAAAFAAPLEAKLREVLATELEPGLTLGQIPAAARLPEVDFLCRLPSLTPGDLQSLYTRHPAPSIHAPDLARLHFPPVRGFLRGVIDLLFVHEGRYYLLDWKSNWLGNRPEDYDPPGVRTAMHRHFYGLQAHLYVAAIDRFLQTRLAGYDYERDFGGFFYLFLRGVDPARPERAIWREKPPLALVQAWRALIAPSSRP